MNARKIACSPPLGSRRPCLCIPLAPADDIHEEQFWLELDSHVHLLGPPAILATQRDPTSRRPSVRCPIRQRREAKPACASASCAFRRDDLPRSRSLGCGLILRGISPARIKRPNRAQDVGAPRRVSCIRTDLGTGRRETSKRGPPPPEQRHPARPLRRETLKRCPTRAGQRNRGPTPSLPRNIETLSER